VLLMVRRWCGTMSPFSSEAMEATSEKGMSSSSSATDASLVILPGFMFVPFWTFEIVVFCSSSSSSSSSASSELSLSSSLEISICSLLIF